MINTETIINYLKESYQPNAIILYGSFADGSATENSDFDALVIADNVNKHDVSVIDGTELDVFVYPSDIFRSEYDPKEFVRIFDGKILLDEYGIAARLQQRVRDFVERTPEKTEEEIEQEIKWCEKMLSRTVRGDAEGFYRWHWLLIDSLEIYCDVKRRYYHGPKKALRQMERSDAEAFGIYSRALREFDRESLAKWISCLKQRKFDIRG